MTTQQTLAAVAFSVELRLEPGGAGVLDEPVREADLLDARSEALFVGLMRRGRPGARLEDLRYELRPLQAAQGRPSCRGFALSVDRGDEPPVQVPFGRDCLDHVAQRGVVRLVKQGLLREGDNFYYDLRVADAPAAGGAGAQDGCGVTAGVRAVGDARQAEVPWAVAPLRPLLERAQPVGEVDANQHVVFYTQEARESAERFSRRGGLQLRPVETGAVLVGSLCACPETGEMFTVISDVLEAFGSEGTEFSLSFSSQTWSQLQTILRARRRQPATATQRILGQAHGHNFRPSPSTPCEECPHVMECGRSTAFLSHEDLSWCRAVFAGQPWQASHVFGLNARGEPVDAFYGLHGARLVQRGYHLLPDFEPAGTGASPEPGTP